MSPNTKVWVVTPYSTKDKSPVPEEKMKQMKHESYKLQFNFEYPVYDLNN